MGDDLEDRTAEAIKVDMAELGVGEFIEVGAEKARVIDHGHHQHDLAERMATAARHEGGAAQAV